jgi:hypothetical protein
MNMQPDVVGPDRMGDSTFNRKYIVAWLRVVTSQHKNCMVPRGAMVEAFKDDLADLGVNIDAFVTGLAEEADWSYVASSEEGFYFAKKGAAPVQRKWSRPR